MKRIFYVTGAAGHLGMAVVHQLCQRGECVRAFILPQDPAIGLRELPIEIIEGDVTSPASLEKLFVCDSDVEQNDREIYVIHLAGIVTISDHFDQRIYDINVGGTRNVIAACLKHRIKRLAYASTVHAIPEKPDPAEISEIDRFDPDSVTGFYAKTKAEATQLVLDANAQGLETVVIHPSGIIGPYDYGRGHLTQLVVDFLDRRLKAAVKGAYDFVDVRDVAAGLIEACLQGQSGSCYILSNHTFRLSEILNLLAQITGSKKIRHYLPMWLAKLTAPLAELWYKLLKSTPLFTRYSLYTLTSNSNFSHRKAARELNYHTRSMKETLRDTVLFLKRTNRLKRKVDITGS